MPEHTFYWHKHTHAHPPTYSHERTRIGPSPVLLENFSSYVSSHYLLSSPVLAKFLLSDSFPLSFFFFINCFSCSDSPAPSISFFSHSVICPQVEYNSCLPRGVMNGRPLLKCLSVTFECLLSLTSEWHTHWAHTHKQAHTHTHTHTGDQSFCGCFALMKCFFPEVQCFLSPHMHLFDVLVILCSPQ